MRNVIRTKLKTRGAVALRHFPSMRRKNTDRAHTKSLPKTTHFNITKKNINTKVSTETLWEELKPVALEKHKLQDRLKGNIEWTILQFRTIKIPTQGT